MSAYRTTNKLFINLSASHPSVSGRFGKEKGLWNGRRVAVDYVTNRGHERRRSDRVTIFGTLVLTDPAISADQIGVRTAEGDLKVIHLNRSVTIFDTTRQKVQR